MQVICTAEKNRAAADVLAQAAGAPALLADPHHSQGDACAALLLIDRLSREEPLLLCTSSEPSGQAVEDFLAECRTFPGDAAAAVYPSHPGRVRVSREGAGEVQEITPLPSDSGFRDAGLLYFRRAGDFLDAAEKMIRKRAEVGGSYPSLFTLNELILAQKRVAAFLLP